MKNGLARTAGFFHGAATTLCGVMLAASPWCFASVEKWWFWPMAGFIFAAAACSGLGAMVEVIGGVRARPRAPARAVAALALCLPFFAYALWRAGRPSGPGSPLVVMEAERSLMLFATPWLLALSLCVSSGPRSRAAILRFLVANAVVVCVYAAVNHFLTGDMQILWVKGNDFHYVNRASAPFFCPNNYVDFATIFGFVAVAAAIAPRSRGPSPLARIGWLALAAVFFGSGFLSASRWGLSAAFVSCVASLALFGFRGRGFLTRVVFTALVLCAVVGGACAVRYTDNPLMSRVREHQFWKLWQDAESPKSALRDPKFRQQIADTFAYKFDRGQYIGAALRAWRSSPRFGIGPGQHTHRWAQFEPTSDGVRRGPGGVPRLKRPRHSDYGKHLYEVHSDWTQLLEEYGTVGFALFLPPLLFLLVALPLRQGAVQLRDAPVLDRAAPLAAWMTLAMLCVHAIFDFPMQVPCLVWLTAGMCALGLLADAPSPTVVETNGDAGEEPCGQTMEASVR